MSTATDTRQSSAQSTAARRSGGRSARVQEAVYDAVGLLCGQGHRDTLTIPQIAEHAGVNPTSIYRRWGTLEALLEEVAVAALTRDEPLPDTGTLIGDVREWAVIIADDIVRPQRTRYLRALVAGREGAVSSCPCWAIREKQAMEMVDRAVARGEKVPQVRQILDHVIAPLYHHAVFSIPAGADVARELVADVALMIR